MFARNAKDFGAVGDGKTKDTAAIQAALDAGGLVTLPAGTYLTGTLYLRSNGGLEIQAGATLLASPDLADYNAADFSSQNRASKAEVTSGGHLIAAVECENVVLCGNGTIDGNHTAFLNEMNPKLPIMYKWTMRPAQMVYFCECDGVHVTDLKMVHSPYWTCFLHGCQNVIIRGLNIDSDEKVINNDGIDIDCCQYVTISDCIINTGDDSITLRGNDEPLKVKRPCEFVAVSNCILNSKYANAIRLGVGNGEIRNAVFNNIIMRGYRNALSIVSNWSHQQDYCIGANIHDIELSNIHTTTHRLCSIKLDNVSGGGKTSACIHDIAIRNVRGTMEITSDITGNGVGRLYNVTLDDVRLTCKGPGPAGDMDFRGGWGHASTDAAIEIKDTEDIIVRDSVIHYTEEAKEWTCDIRATNANVILENSAMKVDKQ